MARERLSGGSTSFQNVPPSSHLKHTPKSSSTPASSSRIPVPVKPRAVLGERVENFDHPTPRQHLVKPVKAVSRVSLTSSISKSTKTKSPRPQTAKAKPPTKLHVSTQSTRRQSPPQSQTLTFSSPGTNMSTPAAANTSRPGNTPHPRRSSVGLGQLTNADESMLMNMTGRDFLISDSETSEVEDFTQKRVSGRGVIGAGRLMTPENSQETRVRLDPI